MSSITTLNGSGVIATDRTAINTNFSNLNSDKIETSYLDTDTSLTANSDSKIATQKAVKAYVDAGGSASATALAVLPYIYPVGAIYMSIISTNPLTVFGFGTWTAWGSGRVPVGVDAGQTEFDTVEETGGEKTHTLTIPEIPSHTHSTFQATGSAGTGFGNSNSKTAVETAATGGGGAHNNLQPYITCYMFKRTA